MVPLKQLRQDAEEIYRAALRAVDPERAVRAHLQRKGDLLQVAHRSYDLSQFGRLFVGGAGKAGAPMARAVEELLGDRIEEGLVAIPYGHGGPTEKIQLVEAGHPRPDSAGLGAARRVAALAGERTGEKDLLLCLLSGGGSALLPLPVTGVTLEEKVAVTDSLLECGASIREMNAVRKHLSLLKGGQLARLSRARALVTLVLSDVVGDDLSSIASGPTAPDETTFGDCLRIVERYGLQSRLPPTALEHLREGAAGRREETPKPGEPCFRPVQHCVVASNAQALKAAADKALDLKYHVMVLSSSLEGEASQVGRVHAAILREMARSGNPIEPPACLISGGETTVTVRGHGKGGRNQELVLAAVRDLAELSRPALLLSLGTDGTDGPTDAAGALADNETLSQARQRGLDPDAFLRENDAYHFFQPLGDLIVTGPTRTNVMDVHLLLMR